MPASYYVIVMSQSILTSMCGFRGKDKTIFPIFQKIRLFFCRFFIQSALYSNFFRIFAVGSGQIKVNEIETRL